jgi:hypothetical protein
MNNETRPRLYLPLALLAAPPAPEPTPAPTRPAPRALRRLVAAMVD